MRPSSRSKLTRDRFRWARLKSSRRGFQRCEVRASQLRVIFGLSNGSWPHNPLIYRSITDGTRKPTSGWRRKTKNPGQGRSPAPWARCARSGPADSRVKAREGTLRRGLWLTPYCGETAGAERSSVMRTPRAAPQQRLRNQQAGPPGRKADGASQPRFESLRHLSLHRPH
jgi:hypothetical protein